MKSKPQTPNKDTIELEGKIILDACCGGRMMWFDKKNPLALFVDNREMGIEKLKDGSNFGVKPDVVMDFRSLNLPSNYFNLVVFDPPHIKNASEKAVITKKYGSLNKETWSKDISKGFSECFRVLKTNGILIFKWNEVHIPITEVLSLTDHQPLFGHRSGKTMRTHWVCFLKSSKEVKK